MNHTNIHGKCYNTHYSYIYGNRRIAPKKLKTFYDAYFMVD